MILICYGKRLWYLDNNKTIKKECPRVTNKLFQYMIVVFESNIY